MAKLLYVEDDLHLAQEVISWLKSEGYTVEHFANGDDAWQCMQLYSYDVIILDWQLIGCDGVELCRRYRSAGGSTWVIMLTGKGATEEIELGLGVGADDYIVKPFELRELSARLKSCLRRGRLPFAPVLKCADVTLDPNKYLLQVGQQTIKLTKRESALLEFLLRNPGRTFSQKQLLDAVWPSDSESSEGAVRTFMSSLRKKFAAVDRPDFVRTVAQKGYMIDT